MHLKNDLCRFELQCKFCSYLPKRQLQNFKWTFFQNMLLGVPWWPSKLRIQHCHCRGSGHCCGPGSIPGPGTHTCLRYGQTNKKTKYAFFFFCFLGPHLPHMEVPRLGIESELQLPTDTTATATQDPSQICDLHHRSRQWILNPLSKARNRNRIFMDTSWVCFYWATTRTPQIILLKVIPILWHQKGSYKMSILMSEESANQNTWTAWNTRVLQTKYLCLGCDKYLVQEVPTK